MVKKKNKKKHKVTKKGQKVIYDGDFDFKKSIFARFFMSLQADFKKRKKRKNKMSDSTSYFEFPQIGRVVSSVRATLSTKLQSLISSPVIFTYFTLLILISCNHSFIRSSIILILTLWLVFLISTFFIILMKFSGIERRHLAESLSRIREDELCAK